MKTILLLILITLIPSISNGQKFMGIKNTTKKGWAIMELRQRGFHKVAEIDTLDVPYVLMSMDDNINDALAELTYTPINELVSGLQILMPRRSTWSDLKNDYLKNLKKLTKLYGKPDNSSKEFMWPYMEGDGNELIYLENHRCNYKSVWFFPKTGGRVSIEIDVEKYVKITCLWD